MPDKQATRRPQRAALATALVALAACTAVIEGSLSDKPSEAAGVGGAAGAQGGAGAGGAGGAASCYECGEGQVCCIKSYDLMQLRCVDPSGPGACDNDEILVECLTQDDCPGTTCCAQGDLSLVLQSVTCMTSCTWQEARLPVCTDNEPICGTQGYPTQCKSCGTMPEGLRICWDFPC